MMKAAAYFSLLRTLWEFLVFCTGYSSPLAVSWSFCSPLFLLYCIRKVYAQTKCKSPYILYFSISQINYKFLCNHVINQNVYLHLRNSKQFSN